MASFWYKLRNWRSLIKAFFVKLGADIAVLMGTLAMYGELRAMLIRADGTRIDLGVLSRKVITDAGVAFLVDDWDNSATDITNMNFHDSGTGTTAEAASQTDLITPAGPTTRATGTKSQPSANILQTVGTITYSGTLAITEHGIFNQAARGAGTVLWDRSVFSAINVASGDSIQFTYQCTLASGG